MVRRTRMILTAVAAMLVLTCAQSATAADETPAWTIVLHPTDFVIGAALAQLHTRRTWAAEFDEQWGAFDIAVHKTAVAIPAPQCRMDYLILNIPFYHHDTPKQASVSERRAICNSFVAFQAGGGGSLTARVEAPLGLARRGRSGVELAACNLLFAFPLSVQVSPRTR